MIDFSLFVLILIIICICSIIIMFYYHYRSFSIRINDFFDELDSLRKAYIAYSDYSKLHLDYKSLRHQFLFGKKSKSFIRIYDNLSNYIDKYNEEFISSELKKHKKYFDNMFKYKIDDDQRRAIITDDDNNLIIASAGSGKTTTIIAKTRYLLDIKKVNPEEIITISFTNAAKDNFIERLGNDKVRCSTFHKLGLDILSEDTTKRDIAKDDFLTTIIRLYFNKEIQKSSDKLRRVINFCAYYFYPMDNNEALNELLFNVSKYNYETLKNKYLHYNKLKTLKSEYVKSQQELAIANFLFLHGIEYEYEPKYKFDVATSEYRQYHPDFYLVDYDIYLEHFGINKNNRAPQYSKEEEEKYLAGIEAKRKIHAKYNTKLIETYSYDFDTDIDAVLKTKLEANGITLSTFDYNKVMEAVMNYNFDMLYIVQLISKFIKMFKGNNFDESKFDDFLRDARRKGNLRNVYLLEVIKDIYLYYQQSLNDEAYIDFDDMINRATQKVKEGFNHKISYIIIDEFQDTSYSRYALVKAIQNKTHAKVVAVGDDWQSIYRFSGCDLALFVNFKKYFPHPKYLYINSTYRNCQNLIDISSSFIMKNEKGQIKKSIHSDERNIDNPIEIAYYNPGLTHNDKKRNIYQKVLEKVNELRNEGCKSIAILGRNNADVRLFGYEPNPDAKSIDLSRIFGEGVVFSTVHKSKGLEYNGVIVCNMEDFVAGFPNKMVDDPIISYVTLAKDNYPYEEERRLFYVALTRTEGKCILIAPSYKPSIFIEELERDYFGKKANSVPSNNDSSQLGDNKVVIKSDSPKKETRRFVDVKFDDWGQVYSYYCPENFEYKVGDRIKIDTPNGISEVTVVSNPYYDTKDYFEYKVIDIIK